MSYLLNYNPGTQQYTYPRRGGAKLSGTAIIHTAECAMDLDGDDQSAEVCASFIANRADYGSYHRLVDSDSIIDMVPWEYEAWQDSETNNWAVGISAAVQAGRWHEIPAARRDRIYRNMAACAADFVQYMAMKGVTVPLRRITGTEARSRVPGFCAHGDSGLYRSDPGVQFDWALFFEYTRQALSGGLSAQGGITASEEDEFMANVSDEEWAIVKQQLAGLVDSSAQRHKDTSERLDKLPAKVLSHPFTRIGTDGKPQGETTIKDTLGTLDANIVIDRSLFSKPVPVIVDSLIAADIAKEVLDLLAVRLAE